MVLFFNVYLNLLQDNRKSPLFWEVFSLVIIFGGILRKEVIDFFLSLKAKLKALSIPLKIILGTIIIFDLAQSAGAPYMIDNETYYIQTIKWLDQYGLVPGLANLHFFLSQMSGILFLERSIGMN